MKFNPCFIIKWRRCDQDNHCCFWIALPPKKGTIVLVRGKKKEKNWKLLITIHWSNILCNLLNHHTSYDMTHKCVDKCKQPKELDTQMCRQFQASWWNQSIYISQQREEGRSNSWIFFLGLVHKCSSIDASNSAPTLLPNTNSFWKNEKWSLNNWY